MRLLNDLGIPDEAFDFSLESKDFKACLWNRLVEALPRALAEDDLTWVNAAGVPAPGDGRDPLSPQHP